MTIILAKGVVVLYKTAQYIWVLNFFNFNFFFLTLPDRQHGGLTDTGAVIGLHFHCVIKSTLQ